MSEEKKKEGTSCKIIILVGFLILFVIGVMGVGIYYNYTGCAEKLFGEGKTFEAISTLFAGLAFVGMFCALFMQRQELSLQREELRLTREELRKTAEANKDHSETSRKNLRAQYLLFWLQNNKELYEDEIRERGRQKKEAEILERKKEAQKRQLESTNCSNKKAEIEGEIYRINKEISESKSRLDSLGEPIVKYFNIEKELNKLTQEENY